MIWHHTRRRTHKRLAPKPVPPEGMMWNPHPPYFGPGPVVHIADVEAAIYINWDKMSPYDRKTWHSTKRVMDDNQTRMKLQSH